VIQSDPRSSANSLCLIQISVSSSFRSARDPPPTTHSTALDRSSGRSSRPFGPPLGPPPPPHSVAPLARPCRLPLLLLLLLVAQLLDGAHRAEHHLGRQLCPRRAGGLAAGGRLAVQGGVRIGVGVRVGDVVVVEVATAAALMRHVARDVCLCS